MKKTLVTLFIATMMLLAISAAEEVTNKSTTTSTTFCFVSYLCRSQTPSRGFLVTSNFDRLLINGI